MRLWHIDLIPYLPDSQLRAQWRELNTIYRKQPKHILINYIYGYDREYLWHYSIAIKNEMVNRGFKIKSYSNFDKYFDDTVHGEKILTYPEHDDKYLRQCFYNLQEKQNRGQKDFSTEIYVKLANFVRSRLEDIQI